jgi:two-component sensor histidine kinase
MIGIKLNIANKILTAFLLVSLFPVVFVGYTFYRTTENRLRDEVSNNLSSIADSRTRIFNNYIQEKEKGARSLAIDPTVVKAMERYNKVFHESGIDSEEYKALDEEYRDYFTYFADAFGFHDLFLICDKNILVFTVQREEDFGTSLFDELLKNTELAEIHLKIVEQKKTEVSDFRYYAPSGEPATFIGTPIIKGGDVIGVIMFQLSNNELYNEVQNYLGLGETGEIVVASREGNEALFIAPLRHDPDAAFNRRVVLGSGEALPIQKAVQGENGSGLSIDYRNKEILAVWRYLPYLRWGVVVKMDSDEAFRHIYDLRKYLIIVGAITIVVVLLITLRLSRSISRPIEALRKGSEVIGRGDLDYKVGTDSEDEVGELSRSFDDMTFKLKESRTKLENEVLERRRAEEEVTASLKEKEVLMKEIHHRVKNNMSVVSSLLRLQSSRVEDEHYRAMFNDSISRIKTMASIHEKLYQSEDLSKIIFSDYIKDTVNNIYKSYSPGSNIKLVTDIQEITLRISAATPCGLIVNELITNSMKYAFPEGREGEIRVSLQINEKGEIELKVADNGVGMPEGLDFENSDSLGLTLVNALVGQLQGNIELSGEKGTEYKITFKG